MKIQIFKKSRKAISPVVATVLLIAMVVVIGLIIFLWFKGMTREVITKFEGTNIEMVCNDVSFDASYSDGILYILNLGNVPVFGAKVKILRDGSHETKDIVELSGNWPELGLNQGGTFSGDISSAVSSGDEIIITPVLIGNSKSGEKTFMCNEEQHGYEIMI